jgi:threonyl-tRNA synthetase
MLVVGPKEAEVGQVNVRIRGSQETRTVSVDQFLAVTRQKIAEKATDLAF